MALELLLMASRQENGQREKDEDNQNMSKDCQVEGHYLHIWGAAVLLHHTTHKFGVIKCDWV